MNEAFQQAIQQFLLSVSIDNYGEQYWSKVAEGIALLYTYKVEFESSQAFLEVFIEARNLVLGMTDDRYIEDISDELLAVIITYYPMPDFWNSDLDTFKKHPSFKESFKGK